MEMLTQDSQKHAGIHMTSPSYEEYIAGFSYPDAVSHISRPIVESTFGTASDGAEYRA